MKVSIFLPLIGAFAFQLAAGLALTDEYRDADIGQSGYLPNHNMDPSIVNSAAFGQLWKIPFNALEQFYAKPLTYTPLAGGNQLLFLASSQNWIRTLDAKTGVLINSRQVHTPFLQSDIGCADIPNYIGIIGTPTIDPLTDIVYFFSKTYIPNLRVAGNTGVMNGVYYFHAVNINTLADVYPPVLIDGSYADNAPQKYFIGGLILQRPSLVQVGNIVYGAFGGHCDQYNYTGLIIGVDIVKAKIITQFSMESGQLAPQSNIPLVNGGGGGAGVWMSGMSLTTDGQRLFAVTGNGQGHENIGAPAAGSSGLQTLGEAVINLAIDGTTGALSLSDYFQPYDYINMDAADQDFGSGGCVLLDPATFSGGGVNKIAVTAGKNGKIYILNANNLGGFKLGPGQTDGILQTIVTNSAVFGAAGSYPLEGGYIYFTPVGKPTQAYSLGFGANQIPQFSFAGQSNEISAGRVGTGVPTVTSLNDKPGTAILWMADPDSGLRAWYAVPQNGVLVNIPIPQVGGANKFQRPTFGDSRLYLTDSNGILYCLGSPINLPLNCTSPVDFGQVALGTKASKNITCTTNIAVTSIVGMEIGSGSFTASNSSLPKGPLAKGVSFTFPVTWDLTNTQVSNGVNASFASVTPGVKSAPLTLITINGVAGYATTFPISLTGTQVSTTPFLTVTPSTVDFGPDIILDPKNIPTIPGIFTISNKGLSNLTILGYAYTTDELDGTPNFTNSTFANGAWDLGYGFTAATLPAIGSKIAPSSAISIPAVFYPINGTGPYASYWQVWSDGGSVNIILEGTAATPPIANFSISDGAGNWLPQSNLLMDFGLVAPGSSSSRQIRICNQGGSSLEIDKSKPPAGVFHISDPAELHESQLIVPNDCAYGTVLFVANTEEYNIPNLVLANSWTLNTDDLNFGVHTVQITGTVISTKVGPKTSNGTTVYNYLGCFAESTTGPRLFENEPLSPSPTMNNTACQTACYATGKYAFAGTEFGDECWCGNTPPPLASQDLTDTLCNYACPGDPNDRCGATGYLSVFYDPTKYTAGADPSLYGPQTIKQAGPFSYQGCYSEATTGRALGDLQPNAPSTGFTIELCQVACQNYVYFGMEYANQCYCGNTLGVGAVNQTSSVPSVNGCSMQCAGNALEYCGGGNRLNLYKQAGLPTPTSVPIGTGSVSSGLASATPVAPSGPTTVTKIAGGKYLGCYSEGTNTRALADLQNPIPGSTVSVETCGAACSQYTYFGVEYSGECYCGNTIGSGSVNQASTDPTVNGCSMPCLGNSSETCGGPDRLNMYMLTPNAISSVKSSSLSSTSSVKGTSSISFSSIPATPTPTGPGTVTKLNGYSYLGCYSEGINERAISDLANPISANLVSVESCAAACAGYKYFGVEYSQECYCGNTISNTSVNQTSSDPAVNGCNMVCTANTSEYCGGGNRLNIYMSLPSSASSTSRLVPSSSLKPTTSVLSSSTLLKSTTSILPSSSKSVTLSRSVSSTTTKLPSLSSVKDSTTSTTSLKPTLSSSASVKIVSSSSTSKIETPPPLSSIKSSTVLKSSSTSSIPSVPSSTPAKTSSSSLISKSSIALSSSSTSSKPLSSSLPQPPTTLKSSTTSSKFSSSSTKTSSTTSTSSPLWTGQPVPNSKIGAWQYMGCANETTGARALAAASYTDGTGMTVESCQAFCSSNNYGLAGLEYSSQCYCANALTPGSGVGQSGCTIPCAGLSTEFCGGGDRLSLFNNTAYLYPTQPALVNGYKFTGCYAEATAGRLLSGSSYTNTTGMTVESCVSFCSVQGGNKFAGIEYAQECYCAASLPTTAVLQPSTSCSLLCTGNNKEFCGNAGMLSVYRSV